MQATSGQTACPEHTVESHPSQFTLMTYSGMRTKQGNDVKGVRVK
jgi:hypothetical protein